jgi:hypothetical protein
MSEISLAEVKELLDDMVRIGLVRMIIDDKGTERYETTDLGRLEMEFNNE